MYMYMFTYYLWTYTYYHNKVTILVLINLIFHFPPSQSVFNFQPLNWSWIFRSVVFIQNREHLWGLLTKHHNDLIHKKINYIGNRFDIYPKYSQIKLRTNKIVFKFVWKKGPHGVPSTNYPPFTLWTGSPPQAGPSLHMVKRTV